MHPPNDLELIEPRSPAPDERQLLNRLLREPFAGCDELKIQLADVRIVARGKHDTRTLVFAPPPAGSPRADTESRVPVDAMMSDDDGVNIEILLHVVDGYAKELEIYRVDGAPITRRALDGPLKLVNWKPAAGSEGSS